MNVKLVMGGGMALFSALWLTETVARPSFREMDANSKGVAVAACPGAEGVVQQNAACAKAATTLSCTTGSEVATWDCPANVTHNVARLTCKNPVTGISACAAKNTMTHVGSGYEKSKDDGAGSCGQYTETPCKAVATNGTYTCPHGHKVNKNEYECQTGQAAQKNCSGTTKSSEPVQC